MQSSFFRAVALAAAVSCLSSAVTEASTTTLDGSPTLFNEVVIGDFDDGTFQGWNINPGGGGNFNPGTEFQNNQPASDGDPTVGLAFAASTLPGVPAGVTIGNLPGQYDILQFRLRFDTLPAAAAANAGVRGDQFFLGGGPVAREAFYVNDGSGMEAGDTVPELPTDGAYHTYTVQRVSTDDGWGSSYSTVRIDPINTDDGIGTFFPSTMSNWPAPMTYRHSRRSPTRRRPTLSPMAPLTMTS